MRPAPVRLAAAAALLSTGCSLLQPDTASCDRWSDGEELTTYSEGAVENGVYMSAPWGGNLDSPGDDLLFFPKGAAYRVEHQLGEEPRWWTIYLSFSRDGTSSGSLAQATGNQAEVVDVTAEHIDVVNGSCVDYWMLIVAGAGGEGPP